MYALIINQKVEKFPYSIGKLRKDNPQVSFPAKPSPDMLSSYGVVVVAETEAPEYDSTLQKVSQDGCQYNETAGKWETTWTVSDRFEDYTDSDGNLVTKAEQEKDVAIAQINKTFREEIAAIKKGYVEDEIKSWPQQIAEAEAYQADNTVATPLLDAIISTKGGTKTELVLRIATNANQYAQVFGAALGKKQKAIADLG